MESLMGKTAIVAGASSGMGRAIALALAADGMWVMAAARRAGKLAELRAAEIETSVADVTDRAQCEALVQDAKARFGGVDLFVYAAGDNIPRRTIAELDPPTWEKMLAVNLTGAFHCTQAVLPAMRAAGGGLIIYISSIAAHVPDAVSGASYHAAKRGLIGLAHATRLEEKAHGIRTSVILPGLCRTELINKRPAPPPPEILARALEPEDVAEAVLAVARLHPRAVVPELELIPSAL
jgi:NADP-dependent 3-hydroxy acid dehydrogenase YdfG